MENNLIFKGNYNIQIGSDFFFGGKLIEGESSKLITFNDYNQDDKYMFEKLNDSEELQSMFALEKLDTKTKLSFKETLDLNEYNSIYCNKSYLIELYKYSNYYFIINKGFLKNKKFIEVKLLPDKYDYFIILNKDNNGNTINYKIGE